MTLNAKHLALGQAGEEAAVLFLTRKGWSILERNWRPSGPQRGLELDIVAQDGRDLVFVEVKTRASAWDIPVYAAFSARKQARFVRAARCYLSENECWDAPCRFDLVCVEQPGALGELKLEHLSHVIELGHLMDSGDASWQPW